MDRTAGRQMLAARIHERGGIDGLVVDRIEISAPGKGEVLVAVRSAGVTADELMWETAWVDASARERLPVVPGHELSGLVVEVGPEVRRFSVGDAVFGIPDFFRDGTLAQFIVVAEDGLVAKPRHVSHDAAAALALSGLTAWQALFVEGRIQAGEHVLIHAGAGGIGHLAVQLARWAGARVSATASRDSLPFVRDIGAHRVIDYRAERFEEVLDDVDLVLDTIGGETLTRSLAVLGEAGRLISIAPTGRGANQQDPRARFFIVTPNTEQLERMATLVASGDIRPHIHARHPLRRARAAYQAAAAGGVRGKIVVRSSRDDAFSAVP
jgi:NADPH:quinone reductase-like Zn-dependent oxidoreductase